MLTSHLDRSGRTLAVHRLATGTTGRTVVLAHPAPGSGAFDPDPAATTSRGVTLLSVDRPGYGESAPPARGTWASVSAAAEDLAAVIEAEAEAPVGVAGWSAGGRVALALAATRPDLVDRVVIIGTPAPHEEVPWIPEPQVAMIEALRGLSADEATEAIATQFGQMLPPSVPMEVALGLLGATAADGGVLADGDAHGRLAVMLEAAFAQGHVGLAADIAGYTLQPWGFDPADVRAKTLLLFGSADPVASHAHGAWWQRSLPDARLEMVPGAGHLVAIPMWGRALRHLVPPR